MTQKNKTYYLGEKKLFPMLTVKDHNRLMKEQRQQYNDKIKEQENYINKLHKEIRRYQSEAKENKIGGVSTS